MRLRNRINLYTSVLFIVLLLIMNVIVYYAFSKLLIDSEMKQNQEEAERIVQGINQSIGLVESDDLLRAYVPVDGMIRIVSEDKSETLTATSSSEKQLPETNIQYLSDEKSERIEHKQQLYSFVSIPIIWSNGDVMNLQITTSLHEVVENLAILRIVLITVSLIAMIPVIISSRLLSNLITTPITSMIDTMTEIRKSGRLKHLEFKRGSKDELEEMGNTFNHMIDILKTNSDKQEQFVSNASHELKTPLTVIESYASLLKRRGNTDQEVFEESIEAIHSEAIRMREMTEQLLLLARPNEMWTILIEPLNLTEFVQQSVATFQKAFDREIFLTIEKDLTVQTDKQKLNQLLYIFLDNARKYSEDAITVTIDKLNDKTRIIISDHGIGIPKEQQSKVFDRFYRVDQARNRSTGGTGLGLSLAKKLADAIGATIVLDSIEGLGTTVKIIFT